MDRPPDPAAPRRASTLTDSEAAEAETARPALQAVPLRTRRRVSLALVLVVLAVLGPFVSAVTAQAGSRLAFVGAVVDDGTLRIDRYEGMLSGDDFAERDGHTYSDKAPGALILALPLYASARMVGAEPASALRLHDNATAWWITFGTSVVPTALLCAVMYRTAVRRYASAAVPAAIALTFGTLLLTAAPSMYAHALSALLGFGAWLAVREGPLTPRRLALAGLLGGAAVSMEYTLAIVVLVVLAWLVWRGARTNLGWFVLGGVPSALLLGTYHQLQYGSPFTTSYSLKPAFTSPTLVSVPDAGTGLATLAGSRGILILTPIVLVAILGCVQLLRERQDRRDVVVALLVFGLFTLLYSSWMDPWGGEVPGPRYLIPALPFLAVPLAAIWQRHRRIGVVATVVGAVILGTGVLTFHLVPLADDVIPHYVARIREGVFTPTVFTMLLGPLGWVIQLGLVAAAVLHLRHTVAEQDAIVGGTEAGTPA